MRQLLAALAVAVVLIAVTATSAAAQCGVFVSCSPRAFLPAVANSPEPSWERLAIDDVLSAWRAAGLEVGPVSTDDYRGLIPEGCDFVRFRLPSLESDTDPDVGGRVFSCPDHAELVELHTYYAEICEILPEYCPWVFVNDNILVQIARMLPEKRAREYERVLGDL